MTTVVADRYPDTHEIAPDWMDAISARHFVLAKTSAQGWYNDDGIDILYAEATERTGESTYRTVKKQALAWRIHQEGERPYTCGRNEWYLEHVDTIERICIDLSGGM